MTTPEKAIVRFEIAPRSIVWILTTIAGVWSLFQLRVVALLLVIERFLLGYAPQALKRGEVTRHRPGRGRPRP